MCHFPPVEYLVDVINTQLFYIAIYYKSTEFAFVPINFDHPFFQWVQELGGGGLELDDL